MISGQEWYSHLENSEFFPQPDQCADISAERLKPLGLPKTNFGNVKNTSLPSMAWNSPHKAKKSSVLTIIVMIILQLGIVEPNLQLLSPQK